MLIWFTWFYNNVLWSWQNCFDYFTQCCWSLKTVWFGLDSMRMWIWFTWFYNNVLWSWQNCFDYFTLCCWSLKTVWFGLDNMMMLIWFTLFYNNVLWSWQNCFDYFTLCCWSLKTVWFGLDSMRMLIWFTLFYNNVLWSWQNCFDPSAHAVKFFRNFIGSAFAPCGFLPSSCDLLWGFDALFKDKKVGAVIVTAHCFLRPGKCILKNNNPSSILDMMWDIFLYSFDISFFSHENFNLLRCTEGNKTIGFKLICWLR